MAIKKERNIRKRKALQEEEESPTAEGNNAELRYRIKVMHE